MERRECLVKSFLIEVSHLMFGLTILLILFCSFNPYLNLFCSNIILLTLITRDIYGGCLLLNCNENNISFLPHCMNFSYIYFHFSKGFLQIYFNGK